MGLFAAGGTRKCENTKRGNGKKTKTRKRRKLENTAKMQSIPWHVEYE